MCDDECTEEIEPRHMAAVGPPILIGAGVESGGYDATRYEELRVEYVEGEIDIEEFERELDGLNELPDREKGEKGISDFDILLAFAISIVIVLLSMAAAGLALVEIFSVANLHFSFNFFRVGGLVA